jgi:uracil-DNA glycosylase family 4
MKLNFAKPLALDQYLHHKRKWQTCAACEIGSRSKYHVFARGTLPCNILFIGEAPGKTEGATGWPFVGAAGKLLDEWIDSAHFEQLLPHANDSDPPAPFTFAITNTVACRPCDSALSPNRPPTQQEQDNCFPRLGEFVVGIARPRGIVFLGKTAEGSIKFDPPRPILNLMHPAGVLYRGGRGTPTDKKQRAALVEFIRKVVK